MARLWSVWVNLDQKYSSVVMWGSTFSWRRFFKVTDRDSDLLILNSLLVAMFFAFPVLFVL